MVAAADRYIDGQMPGRFITFEGGEGAGKSTQVHRLAARLEATGLTVVTTREPGGTAKAEAIRRIILDGTARPLGADAEAILFAAARADHVDRVIRPALAAGQWVICDRYSDSTRVYQGAVGGVAQTVISALERVAVGATRPDLTLILDLPAEAALARMAARQKASGERPDRFEQDELALHERRRQAFLDIAATEPERCAVIDAARSEDEVADLVWATVTARLLREAA